MTVKEIFTEVRFLLRKEEGYGETKDTELLVYANSCESDLARRLPLLYLDEFKTKDTLSKVTPNVIIDTDYEYTLPDDYFRMISIADVTSKVNAIFKDPETLRYYQAFDYIKPTAQNPIYYFTKTGKICICPGENSAELYYIKRPATLTLTDTPKIDEMVHPLFVPYICHRAFGQHETNWKEEYEAGVKAIGGTG